MPNKLRANFTVDIEKVLERAKSYPYICKAIQAQLKDLSQFKQPPLIEQVHEVIYWLHRFSCTSKQLLDELERVLNRIEGYEFKGKENLVNNFGITKDKEKFNSIYSELFLTNFFIKNDIRLIEYEPLVKDGKYKADFKICFGTRDVLVEVVTPSERKNDFGKKEAFLFEKLERVQSGLSIEISGFESYDSSNLWRTPVEAPTHKQIEEIITNFRKFAKNLSDEELPKELPPLCVDYPRIRIIVDRRIPNYQGTFVALSSSRTGEGFPIGRIVKLILDEREHFSSDDFNFVFVDFSNWSHIDRWFLDSPIHRKMIIKELKESMSSRIDGVLIYIASNKKDERLINRRILYLNSNNPEFSKSEVQKFLKFWESEN